MLLLSYMTASGTKIYVSMGAKVSNVDLFDGGALFLVEKFLDNLQF